MPFGINNAAQQPAAPVQGATSKPVYVHYGNSRAPFGRSRNVQQGEVFNLIKTRPDKMGDNEYTRWVFKRKDGSEWTPSESAVSMWVRHYYPEYAGQPDRFFDDLVAAGDLTVGETDFAENDFGTSVQVVKFA